MYRYYYFLLILPKIRKLFGKGVIWPMTWHNKSIVKVKGKTNCLMCPRKTNSNTNTLSFIFFGAWGHLWLYIYEDENYSLSFSFYIWRPKYNLSFSLSFCQHNFRLSFSVSLFLPCVFVLKYLVFSKEKTGD